MPDNNDVWAETVPWTEPNERVSFIHFLIRGLGIPIHPLFRGFLHFYCLQLHHVPPNSNLHIACFIMLREAFLCSEPHFGLWQKYFCIKLQTNIDETYECGGAAISRQAGSEYLPGEFLDTNKKWQEEWWSSNQPRG